MSFCEAVSGYVIFVKGSVVTLYCYPKVLFLRISEVHMLQTARFFIDSNMGSSDFNENIKPNT